MTVMEDIIFRVNTILRTTDETTNPFKRLEEHNKKILDSSKEQIGIDRQIARIQNAIAGRKAGIAGITAQITARKKAIEESTGLKYGKAAPIISGLEGKGVGEDLVSQKRLIDSLEDKRKATMDTLKVDKGELQSLKSRSKMLSLNTRETKLGTSGLMRTTKELRRFKAENLSVMFIAMQLGAIIHGMLSPALEASGIFEIISAIFLMLFLPAMILLIDPLLSLLDMIESLPEPVKEFVGILMTILFVISMIIMFAAQLGMLFGVSLSGLLTPIATAIGGIVTAFLALPAGIIAAIVLLVALVLADLDGFIRIFVNIFTNLWNGLVGIVTGAFQFLQGVVQTILGVFIGIFTGKWDTFFEGLNNMFNGALKVVEGIYTLIVKTLGDAIADIIAWLGTAIKNILHIVADIFNLQPLKDAIDGFHNWLMGIVEGIKNLFRDMNPLNWFGNVNSGGGNGRWLPWFAEGGVVTRPTVGLIGERGPEAVVPLSEVGAMGNITNNITIHANVSSDYDVKKLADEINKYSYDEFRRMSYR